MKRSLWIGISLILAAIICLSCLRPHEIVSPGNLIPGHSTLQNNCFACHAPFQGASAERCTSCHVVADIGLRTTQGVEIRQSKRRPAFHQALTEPDCMARHSDHPRPRLTNASTVRFDHALLTHNETPPCEPSHLTPRDALRRRKALAHP